jgi:hypothetical protein
MVVQSRWETSGHLHLLHVDLLLRKELPLARHEVLLLLLAALKVVLLLSS